MGKKSRRNKKNNGGPLRKGLDAVPTAAVPYETICRLMGAHKYDEILKIESKHRHLGTFSADIRKDVVVLYAFGRAHYDCDACSNDESAIRYFERAKERMDELTAGDRREAKKTLKKGAEICLALLYSRSGDMENAISSHRWCIEIFSRHQVTAMYLIRLSSNFNRFEKFDYTIEVLEESMGMMETVEDEAQVETNLIAAYVGCGEFLKAKAANKNRINHWETAMQSGMIEVGLCNYKAAIACFRELVAAERQKQEYDDSLSETRDSSRSVGLATTLLRHSADNEAEAFAIFQEELDRCAVDPINRVEIFFQMGTGYRKLNKWDQSIEALNQICLFTAHQHGTMLPLVPIHEAMAQTYLEQYCTDTTLDIDQRAEILCQAKMSSFRVHIVSTEMHLIFAQLFYFNGDKQQAYHHLELYLDARLAECKLGCYSCEQRVRHGSVPFSCASCRVASYCGRKHQKLTWKNERICHKVLCPLFGYWRMVKKKQKKHKGLTDEDRCECERVFETFYDSICPHGLIIEDGNLQKADSTDPHESSGSRADCQRSGGKAISIVR